jgi:brefeldin A-resistance guanine nucleotide exchange factor 1
LGKYVDVWGPVCRGETLPVEQIIGESAVTAGLAAALAAAAAEQAGGVTSSSGIHYSSWAAAAAAGGSLQDQQQQQVIGLSVAAAATAAEVAAFEKGLKQRVMLAVDHFNKDYKKGFQFLQVRDSATLDCWLGP